MKKFVSMLFATLVVFTIACGQGRETVAEDEGEDDEEETTTVAQATGTAAAPAAPAAAVPAGGASLAGLVKFEGAPPKMPNLQMGADPYCASQHQTPVPDEEVVLGPGGELANVLVYIKNAPNTPPPSTPALLDQKGCKYVPHVSAVVVNQPVQIRNSDATLHNVHAMPAVNKQFNEGQPVQGMVSTKKFDKIEMQPFRIKCDVHGWMKSYMAVLPHNYFSVSQMNGSFHIAGLPAGNYTVVAWHEKFGVQEQQVTIGDNEQKQIQFTFKG
ncbi:MAG TPA: carboxypeptidase regulatory-like domain-containing protein [Thermoanaerobaculia bacterium]|nr:carboxypeptidase regulatory-like domain-containing protein [Thermoanaerobaculia bacterium]